MNKDNKSNSRDSNSNETSNITTSSSTTSSLINNSTTDTRTPLVIAPYGPPGVWPDMGDPPISNKKCLVSIY
jgi:hypothetical protein